jgi:hypothetical protein
VPNVNVTYEQMQAAARRLQVPVIRLRAATAVTAAVVVALPCVQSGTLGRKRYQRVFAPCRLRQGPARGMSRPLPSSPPSRLREGRKRPQSRRHVQGQAVQY